MNVQEVLKIAKERKSKSKAMLNVILENIHKKILYYANAKKESCSYIIPPIVNDIPLFEREELSKEIFKILDSEGYIVNAYSNGQLDICWNEKLVQQKIKTDTYLIKEEERKIMKLSKGKKLLNERYSLLANPKKVSTELSIEEKLDEQVLKILKEKEDKQKKFSKMVGNFSKV